MKLINYLLGSALLLTAVSCKQQPQELNAQAALHSTSDDTLIGTMDFYDMGNGKVKMEMEINYQNRADSSVAVHFHEHGDCGNMGEDAHGHWNPTDENHGKWGIDPYHSGDIGNIALDGKGHATYSLVSDRWSLKEGDANYIGNLGVIVHGGVDDYATQPTGNSGPRIGCGIIEIKR